MALAFLQNQTNSASSVAGSTLVFTYFNTSLSAGTLVILVAASDNVQTTDGQTTLHQSVADDASPVNTYTKVLEFTNGQGGAAAGATTSIWYCVLQTAVLISNNITVTFSSSITAKAATVTAFTKDAGSTINIAQATQTLANDGADPGSMAISGLTSKEYLFIRGIAAESNSTTNLTVTTNYTVMAAATTTGGGSAANMGVRGEYRILTDTTSTSDPTLFSADCASVFVALEEIYKSPPLRPPVRPMMHNLMR